MLRFGFALCFVSFAVGCGDDEGGDGGAGSPEDRVARGNYLVNNVVGCPDCHTPRDAAGLPIEDQFLAGSECFVRLEGDVCLHSRNLTNHETGLANRTDDEIKRMIRDGIRPSAAADVPLSPVMPYYVFHNMTDADLDAMVAYLRTVPGVAHEVPRSSEVFDVPAPANYLDESAIPLPMAGYSEMERALRGRYLATQSGACIECHTRHVMNDPNVLDYSAFFAGGERYDIGLSAPSIAKNLTSDPETGLGDWTVEDIVRALKEGTDEESAGICPPMPAGPMQAYGGLEDEDALDIAHYIKSLPPIVNAVDDMCTFPPM